MVEEFKSTSHAGYNCSFQCISHILLYNYFEDYTEVHRFSVHNILRKKEWRRMTQFAVHVLTASGLMHAENQMHVVVSVSVVDKV